MKRVVLVLAILFSLTLVSYAQNYDPMFDAAFNKNGNITIGIGSSIGDRELVGDIGEIPVALDRADVTRVSGQLYYNSYVGIAVGIQQDEGHLTKTDYANNLDVTSLSGALLLRLPATDYVEMYGGLGVNYSLFTLSEHALIESSFLSNVDTAKFVIPYAEGGIRFYVQHLTLGFRVASLFYGHTVASDAEFNTLSGKRKLDANGTFFDINIGFAF